MADEKKPNLIDLMRQMADDHLGKAEFLKAFEGVLQRVKELDERVTGNVSTLTEQIENRVEDLRQGSESDLASFKSEAQTYVLGEVTRLADLIQGKLKEADDAIAQARALEAPDPETVTQEVLTRIHLPAQKEILLDTPEDIRNKLEVLQGDERLDIDAIRDLRKELDDLRALLKKQGSTHAGLLGGGLSPLTADKRYTKYHGGASNITVSVTEPTNPELYDLWIDIS